MRRRKGERERAGASPPRRAGWLVEPHTAGPRVRLGVLWFLVSLAAVTSGRLWTAAVVMAATGALAALQLARVWILAIAPGAPPATANGPALLAALAVALVTGSAAIGTGTAGAMLLLVALAAFAIGRSARSAPGEPGAPGAALPIAMLLPAIATAAVVLAVRVDLWAGLFVVVTVSFYDAGSYLLGAEASGRWEGPAAGIIGALAVTFTVATMQLGPFSMAQWWIGGAIVAGTCVLGQMATTAFLPTRDAWVPAMRRLDAYLVAAPCFVGYAWLLA